VLKFGGTSIFLWSCGIGGRATCCHQYFSRQAKTTAGWDLSGNEQHYLRGQPKIQKPKNFAPKCENIIKMIRVTFWVLVFAKTQKGPFYHFNYLFTPRY
jgi:hypothetical protein